MKHYSKTQKFRAPFFAAMLVLFSFTVFVPLASAQTEERQQKGFCTVLSRTGEKVARSLRDQERRFAQKEDARTVELKKYFASRTKELTLMRNSWNAERKDIYEQLSKRADTPERIAAVSTFRTSVDNAVEVRRKEVDDAIATFRMNSRKEIDDRKQAIETEVETFNSQMKSALVRAQEECDRGVDPSLVREHYAQSLKVAKEAFASAITATTVRDNTLRALLVQQNTAIEAAVKNFMHAIDDATKILKESLPVLEPIK